MDRRRSLLAASQTGGGGKKVNRGVAVVEQGKRSGDILLEFEFPCASTISVIGYASVDNAIFGVLQGNNYSRGEYFGQFMSLSFSPQEDDTYIYEIVVEII